MKKVLSKTVNEKEVWILTPDLSFSSYIYNPEGINYLDIFYRFAQYWPTNEAIKDLFKDSAIALNNKIEQLLFLIKELDKKRQYLLKIEKPKRKIYSYRPYQHFLALIEASLNVIHSIKDLIERIDDRYLKRDYYREIINQDWFEYLMAFRALIHHIESPLITIEQGKIIFQFERINELHRYKKILKILKISPTHNLQIKFNVQLEYIKNIIFNILLPSLNTWAKKHIDELDQDLEIDIITGFRKNGSFKTKKISLKTILKIASHKYKCLI